MECGGHDVRTVVRYLARDVLKAIDRVNYFEVMLGHVQVTVREVLLIRSRLRFSVRGRMVVTTDCHGGVVALSGSGDRVCLCTRR
jgi:hypothetical protein